MEAPPEPKPKLIPINACSGKLTFGEVFPEEIPAWKVPPKDVLPKDIVPRRTAFPKLPVMKITRRRLPIIEPKPLIKVSADPEDKDKDREKNLDREKDRDKGTMELPPFRENMMVVRPVIRTPLIKPAALQPISNPNPGLKHEGMIDPVIRPRIRQLFCSPIVRVGTDGCKSHVREYVASVSINRTRTGTETRTETRTPSSASVIPRTSVIRTASVLDITEDINNIDHDVNDNTNMNDIDDINDNNTSDDDDCYNISENETMSASSKKSAGEPPRPVPTAFEKPKAVSIPPILVSDEDPRIDELADRYQGMLEAHAMGDALGGPFEFFQERLATYEGKLEYPIEHRSRWQGIRTGVIGQVTDDTMMTLTLASTIIQHGKYDRSAVILAYEDFANSTFMLGRNTRELFKGITTVQGYENRYVSAMTPTDKFGKPNLVQALANNQSNGSLMRCSPLTVFPGYSEVLIDCGLSNPSKINKDCSLLYIAGLRYLLWKNDPITIYQYLRNSAQTDHVKMVFQQIDANVLRPINDGQKGWVVHAFYCAMFALSRLPSLKHGANYNSIIDMIIMWGGDTDTNAAIAGAIIGAHLGHVELAISEGPYGENLHTLLHANPDDGAISIGPLIKEKVHPKKIAHYARMLARLMITQHKS